MSTYGQSTKRNLLLLMLDTDAKGQYAANFAGEEPVHCQTTSGGSRVYCSEQAQSTPRSCS